MAATFQDADLVKYGTWLLPVQRQRAVPLRDLALMLADLPDATVEEADGGLIVTARDTLSGRGADVFIWFEDQPYVLLESQGLADRSPMNADQLRIADARYVMQWALDQGDETYNTMALVGERLEESCGAVIYDATADLFV